MKKGNSIINYNFIKQLKPFYLLSCRSDNENEDLEVENPVANHESKTISENPSKSAAPGESKNTKKRRKRKAQNAQAAFQANEMGEIQPNTNNIVENEESVGQSVAKKSKTQKEAVIKKSNSNITTDRNENMTNKKKKKKNKFQNQNQFEIAASNEKSLVSDKTNNSFTSNGNNNISNPPRKDPAQKSKNKNAQRNNLNDSKSVSKNNPFAKGPSKFNNSGNDGVGTLPPLRKSVHKTKTYNGKFKPNDKFKSKFQNKKTFNGKPKTDSKGDDGKDISDERLKAYGINPRKFHKKQKYGNTANKS